MVPVYKLLIVDNKVTLQETKERLKIYKQKQLEQKAYRFLCNPFRKNPISIPSIVDLTKLYNYKINTYKYEIEEVIPVSSKEDLKRHLKLASKEFIKYNNIEETEYILTSSPTFNKFFADEGFLDVNLEFSAVPIKYLKKYKFLRVYFVYDFETEFLLEEADKPRESYIIDLDYKNNNVKPLIFDLNTYVKVTKTKHPRLQKIVFDNEIRYMKKRSINKYLHTSVVLVDPQTLKIKLPLNFSMHLSLNRRDVF